MSEDDSYVYDFEYQERRLKELYVTDPFLEAFSTWLAGYDYDGWKYAVLPEDGPDGPSMEDLAEELRSALDRVGLYVKERDDW